MALVEIRWAGRPVHIEHAFVGGQDPRAPLIVFLHEGLGSLAMWKDFPQQLCQAAGCRGLVYSRPGYGKSTPRAAEEAWGLDFMHRQAHEVLPALLDALHIDTLAAPPWLLGHSDGGSITLLYAAQFPQRIAGAIVLAPHILVEDLSVASIEADPRGLRNHRPAAAPGPLPRRPRFGLLRLEPHLAAPAFQAVEHRAAKWPAIRCPVLAVQGLDDEYGTLEQIRGIARVLPRTQCLALADCGHSPHRDQPEALIRAVISFLRTSNLGDTTA
jgi:pimeloyl-ACP methyl ester carboxylesterase